MATLNDLRAEQTQLVSQLRDNELKIRHELRDLLTSCKNSILINAIMEMPTKQIEKITDKVYDYIQRNIN